MQHPDPLAWQKEFLGRDAELAVMLECWRKVEAGGVGPQFVLLLGDSGYGKTRLLHEFYHCISREENGPDGEGYWPDVLTDDFNGMQVNPGVCNPTKEIPWMWWGLRWPQRIGGQAIQRNESVSDGLRSSLSHLEAHAFPLIKKRALRNSAFGFAWSSVQLAAALLPLASFGIHVLKWANDAKEFAEGTHHGHQLWRHIKELFGSERKESNSKHAYRPALHEQEQKALSDRAFDFARAFLDTSVKELPTIPFILVLDDAQEADPTSLDFVEKLYRAASVGNWPLLVIATHWERNWQLQEDQPLPMPPAIEPPDTCFQLLERLFPGQNRLRRDYLERGEPYPHPHFHPLLIGNLNECADILALAYPGLGDDARRHILEAVHGNPKILTDFLQLMARFQQPWWWQDGATRRDLTPTGLEAMRKLPHLHADILKRLIEDVRQSEPHIIESLSLSSAQGVQFLHDLTVAVACELGRPPSEQVSPSLQRAAHPHNLVRQVPARAPTSEFREAIVCRLLQEAHPDVSPERLHNALRQVLLHWFADGKFQNHPEAGRLYTRLLECLDQANAHRDPTAARIRLRAVAEYFVWLHGQWEFCAAAIQLARLDALARALPEWPSLEVLPFDVQIDLINYGFLLQENFDASLRWCEELLKQLPPDDTTFEGVYGRNLVSILHADALLGRDNVSAIPEVRKIYSAAVGRFRHLRGQFHDSPDLLLQEATSLARLGNLELAEGDRAKGREHYAAARKLCQDCRDQFGSGSHVLLEEVAILVKLGNLESEAGHFAGAKDLYAAALKLCQNWRDRLGGSAQRLLVLELDEIGVLGQLGNAELAEGNRAKAKEHYAASRKLCQEWRDRFGNSPKVLQDEAIALTGLAKVELAEGNSGKARDHNAAALKVCQQRVKEFGASTEILRCESWCLSELGDLEMAEGNCAEAREHYEAALRLSQQVRKKSPERPRILHDEAESLARLGNAELAEGDRVKAREQYSLALKLCQRSRDKFGDSLDALCLEAMCLDGLGHVKLANGDHPGAKGRYTKALRLRQLASRQFGDSYRALCGELMSRELLAMAASAAEADAQMEHAFCLFGLLIERYRQSQEPLRHYLTFAESYIKWYERSDQPQKAKPVREWLDGLKSAQSADSSSGDV